MMFLSLITFILGVLFTTDFELGSKVAFANNQDFLQKLDYCENLTYRGVKAKISVDEIK